MPHFAANISMLFREADMLDRPAAARRAGFGAVEVQMPYDHSPSDWRAALDAAGVTLVLINLPPGDLSEGGPGHAAMPGREESFRAAVDRAAPYLEILRPPSINVLPGRPPADFERARCLATLAGNLRLAAEAFAPLGVRVLTEACNTRDRPGFFLATPEQMAAAIDLAGHANLAMQYDVYHMTMMGIDVPETLARYVGRIGHVQFADAPGRHEPGTGTIDFDAVFRTLDEIGYDGYTAAEYLPSGATEQSLGWLAPYLA